VRRGEPTAVCQLPAVRRRDGAILGMAMVFLGAWLCLPAPAAAQTPDDQTLLELARMAKEEEVARKREQVAAKRKECYGLRRAEDLATLQRAVTCLEALIELGFDPLLQPNLEREQDEKALEQVEERVKKLEDAARGRQRQELGFTALRDQIDAARRNGDQRRAHSLLADAVKRFPRQTASPDFTSLADLVTRDYRDWLIVRGSAAGAAVLGSAGAVVAILRRRRVQAQPRRLEMLEGPQPGEVFEIDGERTVVGSLAGEVDIPVVDLGRRVSRRHCEIARSGAKYFLTDLSTNGTRLNGKDIVRGEPVPLRAGDLIALADDVVLRFN
jgi:hypothetical protein